MNATEARKTDKYEIAAAAALANIEGRWLKLTAGQQRSIFGAYLFGQKTVRVDCNGQGRVEVTYSVCFGTDWASAEFTMDQVAAAANEGRRLHF